MLKNPANPGDLICLRSLSIFCADVNSCMLSAQIVRWKCFRSSINLTKKLFMSTYRNTYIYTALQVIEVIILIKSTSLPAARQIEDINVLPYTPAMVEYMEHILLWRTTIFSVLDVFTLYDIYYNKLFCSACCLSESFVLRTCVRVWTNFFFTKYIMNTKNLHNYIFPHASEPNG